ncbi:hypothetical protein ARHIZOSPH14_19030 [Agromyces rhizosphaerae]|uniref:Uncharacterized protein n=1 Tax=Agromyces rhizosphaerae TaxID=88374 RepID=A0A9W6FPL9_9MICO|nr:hypothetical protein [Agromyces rhizosphaerae]GLI27661.1 hypothetical protein ARHIZOSPH14_19030 [Agromyces rhizosphaerae]
MVVFRKRCTYDAADFAAYAVYTGERRLVHVTGSGVCPTDGWELALEAEPGRSEATGMLALALRERPAEGQRVRVLTRVHVDDWFESAHAGEVLVHTPAGDLRIPIEEPHPDRVRPAELDSEPVFQLLSEPTG